VDVLENGSAVLPVKELRQILESEKSQDTVTLFTSDGGIWVESEKTQDSITLSIIEGDVQRESKTMDSGVDTHVPDEFPDVPDFTAESYHEMRPSALRTIIERTIFATEKYKNSANAHLATTGVCFESKRTDKNYWKSDESDTAETDDIFAVATDGYRLTVQKCLGFCTGNHSLGLHTGARPIQQTIVPAQTLLLVEKVLKDKAIDGAFKKVGKKYLRKANCPFVKMAVGKEMVTFQYGDVIIFSRLIDGHFPKWRDIVPKTDTAVRAIVRAGELLAAVKNTETGTTADDPGIFLTFEPGRLTLERRGKKNGKTQTEILVECNGKATVQLDPKFLTSMLKTLDTDTMLNVMMNGYDPVYVIPDDSYQYILQPMEYEKTYRVEKDGEDIGKAIKEQINAEVKASLKALQDKPDDEEESDCATETIETTDKESENKPVVDDGCAVQKSFNGRQATYDEWEALFPNEACKTCVEVKCLWNAKTLANLDKLFAYPPAHVNDEDDSDDPVSANKSEKPKTSQREVQQENMATPKRGQFSFME
jgi:DNA polymerase-3 subunit beta